MSHHDHGDKKDGGPDTRFLDLEMSRVLYDEAQQVTREAFRELLLDAAKKRFIERFGTQIEGLAGLAVDELVDDVFANLEIEQLIASRARRDKTVAKDVRRILGGGAAEDAGDEG